MSYHWKPSGQTDFMQMYLAGPEQSVGSKAKFASDFIWTHGSPKVVPIFQARSMFNAVVVSVAPLV